MGIAVDRGSRVEATLREIFQATFQVTLFSRVKKVQETSQLMAPVMVPAITRVTVRVLVQEAARVIVVVLEKQALERRVQEKAMELAKVTLLARETAREKGNHRYPEWYCSISLAKVVLVRLNQNVVVGLAQDFSEESTEIIP